MFSRKKSFGIPVVNKNEILEYGTEMQVVKIIKEYPGGESDILICGINAFRILDIVKEIPDKLYSGAIVSVVNNIYDIHGKTYREFEQYIDELFQLLEIKEVLVDRGVRSHSFPVAHYIGLSLLEKFELLKHNRESVRQKIIVEHLKKILPDIRKYAAIRERAKQNGQFYLENPPDTL